MTLEGFSHHGPEHTCTALLVNWTADALPHAPAVQGARSPAAALSGAAASATPTGALTGSLPFSGNLKSRDGVPAGAMIAIA